MWKNLTIVLILAAVIVLPFLFRRSDEAVAGPDDPFIVVISPHNEAIRYEFAHGFSKWHKAKYGTNVRIDWRNVGGTTEISRFLSGEYATSARAWWINQGKVWPSTATDDLIKTKPPVDPASKEVYDAYRKIDSPDAVTCKVDLFFGGGQFDHFNAFRSGFAVEPWPPKSPPPDVAESLKMIPATQGGEVWRTPSLFGNAISTFGIVYNVDRLKDLKVTTPPSAWDDLADYRYFRQVGVTDPTKSGSIAKAFEMLVHQKMHDAAARYLKSTGVAEDAIDPTIAANEKAIDALKAAQGAAYHRGDVPDALQGYEAALEGGWLDGIYLIQSIGANARYFTDSATKVSIDVSVGDAAVGMTIDFYGRYQAQTSRAPDGTDRMQFVTPAGGTSVSCDPITLLRGAPHRDIACHFIEYVLSVEGQELWTYAPGSKDDEGHPVGPEKYALRRLPIRRDFYPSTQPTIEAEHVEHKQHAVDDLTDPNIDPYQLAKQFTYYPRWTGDHFGVMRDITRAMCMDSGDELKAAWVALNNGWDAPEPDDFIGLHQLPTVKLHNAKGELVDVPLTWRTAPDFKNFDDLEYKRAWTEAFRANYRSIAAVSGMKH